MEKVTAKSCRSFGPRRGLGTDVYNTEQAGPGGTESSVPRRFHAEAPGCC